MTRLIALLMLGLLVVVGAAAVDTSHAQAGQQFSHDESFSPDSGNVTELNNSNLNGVVYDAHVTVQDANGTEMVSGTDYEWFQSNGTVKTLADGRLANDDSASINYGYSAPTETQDDLAVLMANVFEVQTVLLFVIVVGLIIAAMSVLGGV